MKLKTILATGALLGVVAATTSANTIYFSEDFENGLGGWNAGSGYTTAGSGANASNVLAFHSPTAGGDAATSIEVAPLLGNAQVVYISFDYRGGGGFLGLTPGTDHWLAGSNYSGDLGTVLNLTYDNVWRRYEVSLAGNNPVLPAKLMLEDFIQAASHGAQFDNILITDYSTVPENGARLPDGGTTVALLGFAFTGMACLRRKLS